MLPDFDYPQINKANSARVLNSIIKKLQENGYVSGAPLSIDEVERAVPVHFNLFKSVLDVAREYRLYVYNLHKGYGYDLFSYPSSSAAQHVVDAIQLAMLDNENEYINYYIHDLTFGEKWKPGMVVGHDGEDIELTSDEALWNLLLKEIRKIILENI